MRSNIYSIVLLAITVSSALGAAVNVDPSALESLQQLQNIEGLSARQIGDVASLEDLGDLANLNDLENVEPVRKRQDLDALSQVDSIDNAVGAASQFIKRTEECSTCGTDGSTDYNDSGSTTNTNYPNNNVNNSGSNTGNNYFGNVGNNASYSASNTASSTDNHNQVNNVYPEVPVVADADCGAPCIFNANAGILSEVSTNGCPAQVQPGYTQCNTGVTGSTTVNGNIISCSNIYLSSENQSNLNSCSVQPSNSQSFINILALDCSQTGLASIFGQSANNA
ncbi:uncharacterized protein FA14DRAFT_37985 [Meira miltonrushii]|uniref:Hydrophobin n=1 Tax=Meira miltonrushii TaxID=1280837 RepID=A0A316VGK4_9BASI|nr:uncharacterized protein FA14DRAFT_37985 [Meira miltonrushii]PWN35131.1 hypothetical protein FA14DRAFT_37985 [Meira miltonrushii]